MPRLFALAFLCLSACDDAGERAAPDALSTVDRGAPADAADAVDAAVDASGSLDASPDAAVDAAREPEVDAGPPLPDPLPATVRVLVRLDGEPSPDTRVSQGGAGRSFFTNADGWAAVELDTQVRGQIWLVASRPDARQKTVEVYPGAPTPLVIELRRYIAEDNPAYRFQDPGEPRRRNTTAQCAHCHQTINEAWFASPHRTSASNPRLHDLYAGTATLDEAGCVAAGGEWRATRTPGSDEVAPRCHLGEGVLPTLNPDCAPPCATPAETAGCADCHAPGVDGAVGGRDLLDARDFAHQYGVHCDVCHRVEAVDVDDPGPGVAGKLRLLRPSEPAPVSLGAGGLLPLTFGPSHDSPNPRMGSVQRDHFRDGRICAGCHEYRQPVLVPGAEIDRARWSAGTLPVHTTWSEWRDGPLTEAAGCVDCHMPPDATVSNGADLQLFELADIGVQGGWIRPAGAVRKHAWFGPRQPDSGMLQLAAAVFVEKRVVDGRLEVRARVRNVGAGHAIPTGEPLRALLLRVQAFCGEDSLTPLGGDALPGWAGAVAGKSAADAATWPGARVGDRVRVTRLTGRFHDYDGVPPFDAWPAEDKGLPVRTVAGEVRVTAVDGDRLSFDGPLPAGDEAWLVRDEAELAGAPGFAFARVLTDAEGDAMVPHFAATDVASDNRLKPQQSWTSTHLFEAGCAEPTVRATLIHRPAPLRLARERGWPLDDQVMVEVVR